MRNPDRRTRCCTSFITLRPEQTAAISPTTTRRARWGWAALTAITALGLMGWIAYRLWPRGILLSPTPMVPACVRVGSRDIVTLPGRYLMARVGEYDDELYAHLMSQYLRGSTEFKKVEVLLAYRRVGDRLAYSIEVPLDNDVLASIPWLEATRMAGLIKHHDLRFVDADTLQTFRYQSHVFWTAYNLAGPRSIEDIKRADLISYVARFVQFKSAVAPRIRKRIEPVPRALTRSEAHRLAADIVAVADFYSLPVAPFLGTGAMENNFMNVKGDLTHAIWKKRAHGGDVVLKRGPRGVLILNPSSGIW